MHAVSSLRFALGQALSSLTVILSSLTVILSEAKDLSRPSQKGYTSHESNTYFRDRWAGGNAPRRN